MSVIATAEIPVVIGIAAMIYWRVRDRARDHHHHRHVVIVFLLAVAVRTRPILREDTNRGEKMPGSATL